MIRLSLRLVSCLDTYSVVNIQPIEFMFKKRTYGFLARTAELGLAGWGIGEGGGRIPPPHVLEDLS